MTQRPPFGVLIADTRRERLPLVAAQWMGLRGMQYGHLDLAEGSLPASGWGFGTLLALSYRTLSSLGPHNLRNLKTAVAQGAALYVRGAFPAGTACSFAPFCDGVFIVTLPRQTRRCRLADEPLVPQVLRNEDACGELTLGCAQLAGAAQALVLPAAGNGTELAIIFALRCGHGTVIYDLLPDEIPQGADTPIVRRLASPTSRCFDVGALAAVNLATGGPAAMSAAYNLVLDDRPRDFDFFNVARVTRWLRHIEEVCPGTHVDFAWTPQFTNPSSRYIDALKQFRTGFVWHGLYRHSDHRAVEDPAAEYRKGLHLVELIGRRYGVRFQPVMVPPFECVNRKVLSYLPGAGFIAAVLGGGDKPGWNNPLPPFMQQSTPLHELYIDCVPALRRHQAYELTRDIMLANAALDLPIIAAAHPFEVGLRRFAALYNPKAAVSSHFDHVLEFAREKRLRAMSLEDIAVEMTTRPEPTHQTMASNARPGRIDVAL